MKTGIGCARGPTASRIVASIAVISLLASILGALLHSHSPTVHPEPTAAPVSCGVHDHVHHQGGNHDHPRDDRDEHDHGPCGICLALITSFAYAPTTPAVVSLAAQAFGRMAAEAPAFAAARIDFDPSSPRAPPA